jgi:hypothetical protein
MEKFFLGITVKSFPRLNNKEADAIEKATALHEPLPPDVFFTRQRLQDVPLTKFTFDVAKCDKIFDELFKLGKIKISHYTTY